MQVRIGKVVPGMDAMLIEMSCEFPLDLWGKHVEILYKECTKHDCLPLVAWIFDQIAVQRRKVEGTVQVS